MKFGPVPLADAEGAILAHSVATPSGRLRKGLKIGTKEQLALEAAGLDEITVARLEYGDIHEDEAALQVALAILGPKPSSTGLRMSKAATGRVNLYSNVRGVVELQADSIRAFNAIHPMITLATVPPWHFMQEGGMVATVKIISYGVPRDALGPALEVASQVMRMRPTAIRDAVLVQTVVNDDDGETGHRAIVKRVQALGLPGLRKVVVPHREAEIAAALSATSEDLILILTGSATSDDNDTAPAALRLAGGEVERFGMPVDPGNLLFLGRLGSRSVIGLPGCARSPASNGADWVLERVACSVAVSGDDIAAMGVGGLLKEIPSRPQPRERS
ncbi:MAG: molybdopterin-binding protein [Pseudomonadota bacterium]